MHTLGKWLLAASLGCLAGQASALNILLSNDDGFAAPNLRALHQALKAAGHDVIASAPCQNQSGKGGSLNFMRPLVKLAQDCRGDTVKAGAPGVGTDPTLADLHYVDGTPVMAMLYGLDVLAPARWQKAPDLVISGPNEGHNTGQVNPSSGTVNNAVASIARGVPAIAVSADTSTEHDAAASKEIAGVVVQLVDRLKDQAKGGPLLPAGTGLNVNIPRFDHGKAASLPLVMTHTGTHSAYAPRFVADLSKDPIASAYGVKVPGPGISFGPSAPESGQENEGMVVKRGGIAISVIENNFGAEGRNAEIATRLGLKTP